MWLTLLHPIDRAPWRFLGPDLILKEGGWFWNARTRMNNTKFLYFFMRFLSNQRRSGRLFVGPAISITHFAQVCALRVWRDILVLGQPFESEIREYVHSAITTALLDNILYRLLLYSYHVMNLLTSGDPSYERSYNLSHEMVIQNIKVSLF